MASDDQSCVSSRHVASPFGCCFRGVNLWRCLSRACSSRTSRESPVKRCAPKLNDLTDAYAKMRELDIYTTAGAE
jgi:hypothetical protein